MEQRPRAHSALHNRPALTNKLLHGLKNIIRLSGRKPGGDRNTERFPYPSQMSEMDSHTTAKPYMSQPHLGSDRGRKSGQHASETPKLSSSSERSPSSDENVLQRKPSVSQDFPLRTHPRSRTSSTTSNTPQSQPSPRNTKLEQSLPGLRHTGQIKREMNIDGLPPVMDAPNSLAALSGDAPTVSSVSTLFPKTQPANNKRPGSGQRRPSTANSALPTTVKAPGPLLKLKRSFSQLRLNSRQPDVTVNPPQQHPPSIPSPGRINTPTRPAVPTASSHPPVPPVPPPKDSPRAPSTPSLSIHTPVSPTQNNTTRTDAVTSTAQLRPPTLPPNMTASGALAPMSLPKPVPPQSNTFARRLPTQPPKLSLQPVNHRISLTISPTLTIDTGPVRFSPTVISRPMPLPLLNLPTLTPRSDSLKAGAGPTATSPGASSGSAPAAGRLGLLDLEKQKAKSQAQKDEERRVGKAHLKSMPALPIQGTGRGVQGREEVDDMEDDDESTDDDDIELDDDEGESSSRMSNSRIDMLTPEISVESIRSSTESSISSLAGVGQDHALPRRIPGISPVGISERERTPSTGASSYHSARSAFSSSNQPFQSPDVAGLGVNVVPILKQPTPSRATTSQQQQTQVSTISASLGPLPEYSLSSGQSRQVHDTLLYNPPLPEVDTSRLDVSSFLPGSTTSPVSPNKPLPVLDVKGKGKARDIGSISPLGVSPIAGVAASTRGTGVDHHHHHYDPSKTPTITTVADSRFLGVHNAGRGGNGIISGSGPELAAGHKFNDDGTLAHAENMTSVAQSPTETLREVSLHHHHHHHGGGGGITVGSSGNSGVGAVVGNNNGGGMDYFTAKGVGSGSGGITSSLTSSRPISAYYHHYSRPSQVPHQPSFSNNDNHAPSAFGSYNYPHSKSYRHSVAVSPLPSSSSSSQVQTPRPGVGGGMRSPASLFSGGLSTPKATATATSGYGFVGGEGGLGRSKTQRYSMPKMYKRASQSLIDLHTIETKERKRIMEEEARAEEDMELAKLREKEREREKEKERAGVKEKDVVVVERQSRKSHDDRIKEDDSGDDEDDEEAAEKRDHLGACVPTKVVMVNSPITLHGGAATTATAVYDSSFLTLADAEAAPPPPFSSVVMTSATVTTTSAATKKQNRLSTASLYLRRRRSMPMFDESSEPPPYPSFPHQHPAKYLVMPREDEGRERLPPYTNPIYLKAIMPRKMEFTSPGVQARDRKWRRVMCVLEGTVLRVYKCPPGHAGVGVFGEWWEKQVGAGDVSLQPSHNGAVSTIQIETRESRRLAEERREIERQIQRIIKAEGGSVGDILEDEGPDVVFVPTPMVVVQDGGPEESSRGSTPSLSQTPTHMSGSSSRSRIAQFLKPGTRSHTRSKSDLQVSERSTPTPSPRPSLNIPRSGTSTPGSARSPSPYTMAGSLRAPTPISNSTLTLVSGMDSNTTVGRETPSSSTFSSVRGGNQEARSGMPPSQKSSTTQRFLYTNRERDCLPDPDPSDLMRSYTLQNAESGIGNDYAKRKNVIRLRLDGEQFLLQARDVTGVVEWIEALQAATNIALDLDERPMPRGPLFPRRRRRRRQQAATGGSSGGTSGQAGSATVAGQSLPVATA